MADIYDETCKALRGEGDIVLATVVSTSGSTPTVESSKLLVKAGGLTAVGTIGGGCLEANVLTIARALYGKRTSRLSTFDLSDDDVESGLICGGRLEVLVETLDRSALPVFEAITASRMNGEDTALVTEVRCNEGTSKFLVKSDGDSVAGGQPSDGRSEIVSMAVEVIRSQKKARFKKEDGTDVIIEPIAGFPSLIIFGAGHVSKFISQYAKLAGFKVTVVDDRAQYANKVRFPEADVVLCDAFARAFERLTITSATYVVIVTRGHRYDEEVLERAVHYDAKYIGMIGSRRKVLTIYEHLIEHGIPEERLKHVFAPMGLEIGAATPEEIGISIVSELIKIRRLGGDELCKHKSDGVFALLEK